MGKRIPGLFLLATIPVLGVYTQQFGELRGTITDSSGAVIVDASVTVTNVATQQVRAALSNEAGIYSVPAILPGIYNVRVEKAGFKTSTRTAVEVQVGDVIRADFSLQLGEISQAVEVTGAAELLNTQSSAMGSVVTSQQIVDLPLNGRDYLSLVTLSTNASAEKAVRGSAACREACAPLRTSRSPVSAWSLTTTPSTAPRTRTRTSTPTSFILPSTLCRNSRCRPAFTRPSSDAGLRKST